MEVVGEAIVSSCNTAEILEAAKHPLDGVAIAVEVWREAGLPDAVGFRGDVRCGALRLDLLAHGITVVAFVALHELGGGELIEQHIGGYAIRDMSAGQQEGDGATVLVGQGMDLGRATAARPADRLVLLPPFPPAAQR